MKKINLNNFCEYTTRSLLHLGKLACKILTWDKRTSLFCHIVSEEEKRLLKLCKLERF
jgi:hypothetical protein